MRIRRTDYGKSLCRPSSLTCCSDLNLPPPTGHNEVAEQFGKDPREYSISTKEFQRDADGNLTGIKTVRVEWTKDDKGMSGPLCHRIIFLLTYELLLFRCMEDGRS